MNETDNQFCISNMASLVPLFSVREKISSRLLGISLLTFGNYIPLALYSLPIVLNLILASKPIMLASCCMFMNFDWLFFFPCPSDLLTCYSKLCKRLGQPKLILKSSRGRCCGPHAMHSMNIEAGQKYLFI